MTVHNRQAHAAYQDAPPEIQSAVDVLMNDILLEVERAGFQASGADPAEDLTAAVYTFIYRSNPQLQRIMPRPGGPVMDADDQ